jgi:hypothetical protein
MLTFGEETLAEPIIYTLGQQFNLITNITQANVTEDQGWCIVEIEGPDEDIEAGITWAISRGVRVEPTDS